MLLAACSSGSTEFDNSATGAISIRAADALGVTQLQQFQLTAELVLKDIESGSVLVLWEQQAGPGMIVFNTPSALTTNAVVDQPGTYSISLQATQGELEAEHLMTLLVADAAVNTPPTVSIVAAESVVAGRPLALNALVADDGLPDATLGYSWSSSDTSGSVTFAETSLPETSATFATVGSVDLQLSVSDGELDAQATHPVQVLEVPFAVDAAVQWQELSSSDGSEPQARHEAAAVAFDERMYLLGGRGMRQVDSYDPTTASWQAHGVPDFEYSHFQPVVYDDKIYVIGALNCCYPNEEIIPVIKIFDPATDTWSDGATIPANRRRGSAGTVVHDNKIYLVAGTTNGHNGGMVKWFDEYDPATDSWKTMPDAPTARDHFSAVVVHGKLVAAGGRQSAAPNTWINRVTAVDVFDFSTGSWSSGAPIPTTRAGTMAVGVGEEVIVIGGEQDFGAAASNLVEAYNVNTDSWRTLSPLNVTRHGGGIAILENGLHVVSGNLNAGGGAETSSHELLPGSY